MKTSKIQRDFPFGAIFGDFSESFDLVKSLKFDDENFNDENFENSCVLKFGHGAKFSKILSKTRLTVNFLNSTYNENFEIW